MRLIFTGLAALLTLAPSSGAQASMSASSIGAQSLTARLNVLLANQPVSEGGVVRTVTLHTTDEKLVSLCPSPELSFTGNDKRLTGRRTVLARCGKRHIYLPVFIHATGTFWKARQDLPAGRVIKHGDIEPVTGSLDDQPVGLTFRPENIVGQWLTRSVSAGTPVLSQYLRKQWQLRAGQQVEIVTTGKGFRIRSQGRALNNAAVNDRVKVKTTSGRTLSGTVEPDGQVSVLLQE